MGERICSIDDCTQVVLARSWCLRHYTRWHRTGDPLRTRPNPRSHPVVDGKRECTQCGETKPVEMFNRTNTNSLGRHPWCKACRSASRKALYAADPSRFSEQQRWKSTKWRYGVTREQYDAMHEAAGGSCAICGKQQDRLAIDHDHSCCPTDKTCGRCLRGLLCFPCNSLLGLANDDPDRLLTAVAYLRRWSPSQ